MIRRCRSVIFCLAVLTLAFSHTRAAEGLVFGKSFESPAVDGTIWCMEEFNGELIVGGRFDQIGREAISTLAAWNGSSWRSMGLDAVGEQRVYCMTIFEGALVVGVAKNDTDEEFRVLRLFGNTWVQIGGDLSSAPRALAVHEGYLFVGLGYSIISRGERPLYQLIGDIWLQASFPASEIFVSVHSLLSVGQTLYVGGSFDGIGASGGAPRGVYSWTNGVWALVGSGLQSDAEPLSALIPQGHQGVHDLEIYGGDLYATGSFVNEADGLAGMARWTGASWEALPTIGVGRHLTISAQGLVATGLLAHDMGGGLYRYVLAAWDGSNWNPLDPATNASPMTTCAGSYGGQTILARDGVVAGGYFGAGITPHGPGLTAWDGNEWTSLINGFSPGGQVNVISDYQGQLLVGGFFEFAGAIGSPGVATFDGSKWHTLGDGLLADFDRSSGANGVVALLEFAGSLVASGRFFGPDENELSGVAFWDGSRWSSLTPGSPGGSTDGSVRSLAVYGGELYAGGQFAELNGLVTNGLARFDGLSWEAVAANDAPRNIRALAVFQGQLIVGGSFSAVDGVAANGLASYDGVNWSAVSGVGQPDVTTLAVFQNELYIGRACGSQAFAGQSHLYRWNGMDAPAAVVDPAQSDYFVDRGVNSLVADADELHVLTLCAGSGNASISSWDGAKREPMSLSPGSLVGLTVWAPRSLGMANGSVYLGGGWRVDGDPAPKHLAKLTRLTEVPVAEIALDAQLGSEGVFLRWDVGGLPDVRRLSIEYAAPGKGWGVVWRSGAETSTAGGWLHDLTWSPGMHRYRLIADVPNDRVFSRVATIEMPSRAHLRSEIAQIAPNPFNPVTNIEFYVANPGPVRLRVFDVSGRLVRTIVDQRMTAGTHTRSWAGRDARGRPVGSGVYLVVMEAGNARSVRRTALVQ